MKIVICGSYISNNFGNIHEAPLCEALVNYGHNVVSFKVLSSNNKYFPLIKKLGIRFHIGKYSKDINANLIRFANKEMPDCIFFYNCPWVKPKTLKALKPICKNIMVYCNDDPFSKKKKYFNRNIRKSYKIADIIYAYRPRDIKNIKRIFKRESKLLLPSFNIKHFQTYNNFEKIKENFHERKYDISFIGHYENDNRTQYLKSLIKSNKKILIAGDKKWNYIFSNLKKDFPNLEIKGFLNSKDYVKTLSISKSALCLFSKINSDILTRRVFEIPATGTYLICKNSYLVNDIFGLENYIDFETIKEFEEKINNIDKYFNKNSMIKNCHALVWAKHNSFIRYSLINNDLSVKGKLT